jgi:hypothetical protein
MSLIVDSSSGSVEISTIRQVDDTIETRNTTNM